MVVWLTFSTSMVLVVEIPPTLTLSKNKAQIKNNAIDYTRQVTIPKEITPKQICYLRLRSWKKSLKRIFSPIIVNVSFLWVILLADISQLYLLLCTRNWIFTDYCCWRQQLTITNVIFETFPNRNGTCQYHTWLHWETSYQVVRLSKRQGQKELLSSTVCEITIKEGVRLGELLNQHLLEPTSGSLCTLCSQSRCISNYYLLYYLVY